VVNTPSVSVYLTKRKGFFLFFLICMIFTFGRPAVGFASFGITPPYFVNESLTRLSEYKQKIILVRGDPTEDLKAKIDINVPGANDWISVDRGNEFVLPKGEQQIPIYLKVSVPKKAVFGEYKGAIRIVLAPPDYPRQAGVTIAIGAQVDVDLTVIDKQIIDLRVARVNISNAEEGRYLFDAFKKRLQWLFFPGKISLTMQIENKGNVDSAPDYVQLDISDVQKTKVFETVRNSNNLENIQPFEIKTITADFPTRLPPSGYSAYFKIFSQNKIISEGELSMSILTAGTLAGYSGYGILGLSIGDKASIFLVFIVILALLVLVLRLLFHRKRK
jgi:hypothetical protein